MTDPQQTQQFQPAQEATQMIGSAQATQMVVQPKCPVCQTDNPPGDQYCLDCGFLLSSTPVEIAAAEVEIPGKLIEQGSGREFPLKLGENTVGRQDCDVLLTDGSVSRRHAKLTLADGECVLEDVGSSNGTFVDGKQAGSGEPVEVASGAEIKFGGCAMRLEIAEGVEVAEVAEVSDVSEDTEEVEGQATETEAVAEEAASEEPAPEAPATVARLIGIEDTAGEYFIVSGENTVGRRAENMIAVSGDPYVSGSHAVIAAGEDGFQITDVGSSNGTFVRGDKLTPHETVEIQPGDEVVMGKSKFRFSIGE